MTRKHASDIRAAMAKMSESNSKPIITTNTTAFPTTSNWTPNHKKQGARKGQHNRLSIIFQIRDIYTFGIVDLETGKKSQVKYNPYINPKLLAKNTRPTGSIFFSFTLLKEDKSNLTKLQSSTPGKYMGSADSMPFNAPYVTYKALVSAIRKKKTETQADERYNNDVIYKIELIENYRVQPITELSKTMAHYILVTELKLSDFIAANILSSCTDTVTIKKETSTCYNLTKLQKNCNPSIGTIWDRYIKESPHSIGKLPQFAMAWFQYDMTEMNVYDRSTVNKFSIVYNYCLDNPMEVYFEEERTEFIQNNPNQVELNPKLKLISQIEPLVSGSIRKVKFRKALKELDKRDVYDKIIKLEHIIAEISVCVGNNTIFYNLPTPKSLEFLPQLINLGIIVRHYRYLDSSPNSGSNGRKLEYFKLTSQDTQTETIIRGFKSVLITNISNKKQTIAHGGDAALVMMITNTPSSNPTTWGCTVPKFCVVPDSDDLNPKQQDVYNMVLIEKRPVVCISGPPGTGKTKLIHKLYEFYVENGIQHMFYATAFVNTGITRLNSMGIPGRGTCSLHASWKHRSNEVMSILSTIQILVVEEFSTYSEDTTSKLMEMVHKSCPNLTQIVLVFDDQQIKPIENGHPAVVCLDVFNKIGSSVVLSTNHRVNNGPECEILVENGLNYRNLDSRAGDVFELKLTKSCDLVSELGMKGCFHIPGAWGQYLRTLYRTTDVMDIIKDMQTITFKNDVVAEANGIIEPIITEKISTLIKRLYPDRIVTTKLASDMTFIYPGKRVVFTNNVAEDPVSYNIKISYLVRSRDSDKDFVFIKEVPDVKFSGVSNGEFVTVRSVYKYWPARNEMVDYRITDVPDRVDLVFKVIEVWDNQIFVDNARSYQDTVTDYITGHNLTNINPTGKHLTKFVLVHDYKGVPARSISSSSVVTVDKYQGAQSKHVVLICSPGDGSKFSKEHGLVAITRMEDRLIILGNKDEIVRMSTMKESPRLGDLGWRLLAIWNGISQPVESPGDQDDMKI